ncbi:MAG: capping complex subunit for YIEGIA [bacterium]
MESNTNLTNEIIAIITNKENSDKIDGGVPIFYTDNDEQLEEISMLLARITLGMVHDLGNGVKLIIKH